MYANVSYVLLQKLFRQGKIKVNGKKAKASQRLEVNDVIKIYSNQLEKAPVNECGKIDPSEKQKAKKLFDEMLIFENDDFFALNKTAGLAVQPGSKVSFCVETILKAVLDKYFLVHRLDKDTTGVIIFAKSEYIQEQLIKQMEKNIFDKKDTK